MTSMDTQQYKERTIMMLLCTNMRLWACNTSKDGLEDAISDMKHWRVGGSTHRKVSAISNEKKW